MSKFTDRIQILPTDSEKITALKRDLSFYNNQLKYLGDKSGLYYRQGTILLELEQQTKDRVYLDDALNCFNEAINLTNSKKPLYLVARSKLYANMGLPDLAVEDIRQISKLPKDRGITSIYIQNTINDIAQLDSVQASVNSLENNNKISSELASILREHANVTASLVVQVGFHSQNLEEHGERIEGLESNQDLTKQELTTLSSLVQDLQSGKQLDEQKIAKLEQNISELKQCISELTNTAVKHEGQMAAVTSQVIKTQTGLDELVAKTENAYSKLDDKVDLMATGINQDISKLTGAIVKHEGQMAAITPQVIKTQAGLDKVAAKTEKLDNRVNLVETDINIIKEWQVYIDDTLVKANVLAEVETKEKLESLKKEHGVEVYEYAIKFYGTLTNVLLAYRMISTGVIKEKKDYSNEIVKKISKALGLGDKFSPPLIVAEKIMPVVNDFYEKYAGKCKVDPKTIFDNISDPLFERDLNLAIASSAIKIAIAKKQILKAEGTQEPAQIEGVKKWFSDTLNKQEAKTSKNTIPESKASKMASEDVALFIINSIAQSKFGQNSEEAQKLKAKIEELFKDDMGTKQLLTELYNKTHPQETTKSIVVNVVDKIIYDNPLLNDFKLMKEAAELFGFDKALNLSKELSQDLIKEAIKNDDHDIILGGLLSLVGEINIPEL